MKLFSTVFFVFALGVFAGRAELPAGWSTNYEATLAAASTNQRPALLYFTASWCGPCKLMTRITLTDPAMAQTLPRVEPVAIDIDEHPRLASKHGISVVPTFVMLSAGGDEVVRASGFQPVGEFLEWLTNGISRAQAAAVRRALSQKELGEVDRLLSAAGTNSTRLAAAQLFVLCAAQEQDLVQAADDRLQTLAARDPAVLLDGLNDPRLAVRIHTANALRLAIGESFDVDPWSDAAAREKAINSWRGKLAGASGSGPPH